MSNRLVAPAPVINPETEEFWRGTAQGELRLRRCMECGTVIWYPRRFCPACWSSRTESFTASGGGVVYSYTVNHRGEGAYRGAAPYVLAYVELAEGPRLLTNIVTSEPSGLAVGAPVEVVFDQTDEEASLPRFRIVSERDAASVGHVQLPQR